MSRRIALPLACALAWIAPLPAQTSGQTGAGRSVASARYDPLAPAPPVAQPQGRVFRGQPVIGWEEYLRRKESLPVRPPSHTAPVVETRDLTLSRSPQSPLRAPLALSPTVSFEGIPQTALVPPDPDMAAGPDDLIQIVNSSIARYSKTGERTSLATLQQWYAALVPSICVGGAANCTIFDPAVRYDQLHGRFVVSAVSEDALNGRTHFLMSVSGGAGFGAIWRHFAFDASLNGSTPTSNYLDFPQSGYDNNAVYLTGNMYNAFNTLQYAKIRILKKSELYNPNSTAVTYQDIWDLKNEDNTVATSLRPLVLRGRPGAGTPPGILVNASDNPTADYLTVWRINNPTGTAPTAVRTTVKNLWTYSYPAFFSQLGTTWRMDPGDARVLKAVVRDGALFTARNSGYANDPTTVTWDRIDLASGKAVLQSRMINGNFFFPAFDVPATLGPDTSLPNILIAGSSTTSAGEPAYLGIPGVKNGEAPYEGNTRWGDYFGGAVDPVNGGLWVYGEYAKERGTTAGRWATWAAYFPWSSSQQFTDVASASPYFHFVNVMRLGQITTGCTAATYCPADTVTRGQMAVFIIRAVLDDAFEFPSAPYFTDVPATHPYFKYIQKMRELGITQGCTAATYCPDNTVTRSEMAVFLVRGKMAGLFGDNFTYPATPYFTDVPTGNPRFPFVQKLREMGVTTGCTATTYCPEQPVLREQMAVFIVRSFLN